MYLLVYRVFVEPPQDCQEPKLTIESKGIPVYIQLKKQKLSVVFWEKLKLLRNIRLKINIFKKKTSIRSINFFKIILEFIGLG